MAPVLRSSTRARSLRQKPSTSINATQKKRKVSSSPVKDYPDGKTGTRAKSSRWDGKVGSIEYLPRIPYRIPPSTSIHHTTRPRTRRTKNPFKRKNKNKGTFELYRNGSQTSGVGVSARHNRYNPPSWQPSDETRYHDPQQPTTLPVPQPGYSEPSYNIDTDIEDSRADSPTVPVPTFVPPAISSPPPPPDDSLSRDYTWSAIQRSSSAGSPLNFLRREVRLQGTNLRRIRSAVANHQERLGSLETELDRLHALELSFARLEMLERDVARMKAWVQQAEGPVMEDSGRKRTSTTPSPNTNTNMSLSAARTGPATPVPEPVQVTLPYQTPEQRKLRKMKGRFFEHI